MTRGDERERQALLRLIWEARVEIMDSCNPREHVLARGERPNEDEAGTDFSHN